MSEAWLNRTGTVLGVVWSGDFVQQQRVDRLLPILEKKGLAPKEITGEARKQMLRSFLSGAGWYRGAAVDRLSEEEAGIVAGRLVRRLQTKASLPDGKTEALRLAFADVFKRRFAESQEAPERGRRDRLASELVDAGRKFLDEVGIAALQEAIASGYRP